MKRIAFILLALTTLTAQLVKAQTCPTTATYTNPNQSGPFDLTSGKTILLNDGKSHQITIQNDFSSTSSICVLNGSTLSLTFQNVNSMGKGGFINVDNNATLTINSSINNFPLTINNSGTTTQLGSITYADGATIINSGTYSIPTSVTLNSGTVTFTNSGTLNISGSLNYNNGTFTMTNAANSNVSISGNLLLSNTTIKNLGNFNVSGDVTLQSSSVITNNSYMTLSGALAFSGATFTNNGVIYSSGSTTINTGSTFNNNCTIKSSGSFSTNGTVSNNGNLILASSFTNQGAFTNGTNGWVQGLGDFSNNGTITGSGNFYFVGTTTNQGPFNGTSSTSSINFYDATLNNGKKNYFDNQNTNPTNTTKNAISPNNATSFTSCADLSAPVITAQPSTQMLCSSSTTEAMFSVTATSNNTPTYQWYKNGTAISGATNITYSATGLTFADTSNIYYVAVTNTAGITYSNKVYVKYVILTQPSNLDIAVGSTATFTVSTAWATGYQWQKNSANISGATSTIYAKTNVALADAGSYAAVVTYSGGTCTSNSANLVVENLPTITTQPQKQMLCSNAITSATFSVAATSTSTINYQWYKNGTAISDAKSSSYTATGLSYTDTTSLFYVVLTNNVGSTTSNNASIKYVIVSQPTPLTQYLATGSSASFTIKTSGATSYQWQLANSNITGATSVIYTKTNIALTDAGSYTAIVGYDGGTCTSNAATLTVENLPVITTPPASQVFCTSATTAATFSVTAAKSVSNLTYQWYKNSVIINGATTNSLNLNNLTFADTSSTYYVVLTNGVGSINSSKVFVKYVILNQPTNLNLGVGSTASFSVVASGVSGYQWQKANANISGATSTIYTKTNIALTDAGSYAAVVSYSGGTCTSNAAILTVQSLPSITSQPVQQVLCSSSITTATFSVSVDQGISGFTYQWYKNGTAVAGATSSSYSPTGLTMADTANTYYVAVTNSIGTVKSNSVNLKYLITAQPFSQVVATGNSVSFSVGVSGVASYQWQKKGVSITGATSSTYTLPVVNYSDAGNYTALVSYSGAATACASNAAVLQPSIVLYSKASGNLNLPSTWGVATDGSGSSPLDFTRNEHTFILSNRSSLSTGGSVTIAGTVDVAGGKLILTPGTTLSAGRIIRSLSTGTIAGSSSSNLSLTGISIVGYSSSSDLYFDPINDTLHNLTIATIAAHTVTLHTALAITAGTTPGSVQVNGGGTLNTSDSLVLKSDINGTASIASSAGMITGKVTIEKFIHARRAWRLMSAPITSVNAPSINAAWQEGATSSTDNPHPGFGTHITYGALSDGFDQNPQKTFSMKVYNSTTSSWVGVPATKTTVITSYPAYFIFIRGNRSYNILTTTGYTTPMTTVLRATGNVNQGNIAAKTVAATGLTLVANPYASPVNFTKIVSAGSNIKARYRVWDPTLAGTYGVGAWVTVDGSTGTYKAIPPSSYVAGALEAGQGFFVESSDGKTAGSLFFTEAVKDATLSTTSADRMGGATTDTSLEVNLKLFNADTTTAIADGVLFHFGSAYNDSVDNNDAGKLGNTGENLAIKEGNSLLTIDERTMPKKGDSLYLSFTNAPSASYQFEIVPSSLNNQSFALYDRYLKTLSPLSSSDTTRITFSVNTSVAASKAADRFVLVVMSSKITNTVLPVVFTGIKAAAKEKTIEVQWTVANESGILYYEVQKSADGRSFTAAGNVLVNGASLYSFSDASPVAGANYYRIKSVSKNGAVLYSAVAAAQWQAAGDAGSSAASSVSVYPNPLKGTSFTLTLSNMAAGSYELSVMDGSGKAAFSKTISHNGGSASQTITLNHALAAGIYYIKITSPTATANMVKVIAL